MDQFLSIIIFSIPGLLVYFWIQAFGLNPTIKHTTTEQAAIAALFWVPTVVISVATYDYIYWILDHLFMYLQWNLSWMGLKLIGELRDLQVLATNLYFITFFFLLSIIFSYLVARVWSNYLFDLALEKINKVRLSRKLAKLDDTPSVWDAFFSKYSDEKEESLIVQVYKVDKSETKITGSVKEMSRPFEPDRAITLEYTEEWKDALTKKNYKRGRVYIDMKSGMVAEEIIEDPVMQPVPVAGGESSN